MNTHKETQELFTPISPSEKVHDYLKSSPRANWQDDLDYLLSNHPQVENGTLRYLIEGGSAVSLLKPDCGRKTKDVDAITISQPLEKLFYNSKRFDIKNVWFWFLTRNIPHSESAQAFLFRNPVVVPFRNHLVQVLNQVALAATKSKYIRFAYGEQRDQDIADLEILGVSDQQIRDFADKLAKL